MVLNTSSTSRKSASSRHFACLIGMLPHYEHHSLSSHCAPYDTYGLILADFGIESAACYATMHRAGPVTPSCGCTCGVCECVPSAELAKAAGRLRMTMSVLPS